MKKLALIPLMLAFATPALAQNAPEMATLTADGTGTVFAAPDIVVITIGVTTRDETPGDALAANSADMQAVIDSLIQAGVLESNIATSNFSISPIYANRTPNNDNEPLPIIGYSVGNQVTVRVDIDAAGGILDGVVAAGANQINGIRFDISEPGPLRDEAMADAIAEARRKAELMAEAAGVRLVRIVSVSAYADAQPQFAAVQRLEMSVPIMGGEQSINANATLVFEIAED